MHYTARSMLGTWGDQCKRAAAPVGWPLHSSGKLRQLATHLWQGIHTAVATLSANCLRQVASALMARHIGGAVNYVGVADTLSISPSSQAAGLAADSLICAFYFAGLFKLASSIGPDPAPTAQSAAAGETDAGAQRQEQLGGIQVSHRQPSTNRHLCKTSQLRVLQLKGTKLWPAHV